MFVLEILPENLLIIEGANDVVKLKILDFGMPQLVVEPHLQKAGTPVLWPQR